MMSKFDTGKTPNIVPIDCDPNSYLKLLANFVLAKSESEGEIYLTEAFELGRALVDNRMPPDSVTMLHHEAVIKLANENPAMITPQVAARLTRPLIEMTMAYGLAFREQIERRYEDMLNIRLEESRKLEAIGTLAAGIAHDFNNLLGSIIGFAEMAGDYLADDTPGKRNIHQVLKASFRARDLVSRMLAFARQSPTKLVPLNLFTQVDEALALLGASLPPSIELSFQSEVEEAYILGDPTQIQQIVMNLCINAADAMLDHGTIEIKITVTNQKPSLEFPAHPQVSLVVADHGMGMSRHTMERLFDPFFTTKAPGKGSGLGLSVVYGIVKDLGGLIQVDSHTRGANRGTVFTVKFPIYDHLRID